MKRDLGIYWKYFKYVMEHKKNVFKVSFKKGMFVHAFTHDLSKFSPKEFKAYALYFYGNQELREVLHKEDFDKAWLHHQRKNKHHWDYWVNSKGEAIPMPCKYINQMIVDWEAMSIKFGDTASDYYINNMTKLNLHLTTRCYLECKLGLISEEYMILGKSMTPPIQ